MVLDTSEDAAAAALDHLFGWARGTEHLVEVSLRPTSGNGKRWVTRAAPIEAVLSGGVAAVQKASTDGADAYVGACSLTAVPQRGRGGSALRGMAGGLWLDIDTQAPGREGPDYFADADAATAAADEVLASLGLRAGLVVGSGWGVQMWILLTQPVPAHRASAAVRSLATGIRSASGKHIDRVHDVTRVMRWPGGGTLNWRGGPGLEQPAGVLRRTGERYSIEQVEAALSASGLLCATATADLRTVAQRTAPVAGQRALLDLDAIFNDAVAWDEVLLVHGWSKGGTGGRGEQEWSRPGRSDERSAAVYTDRTDLLVVYSDAPETGLSGSLRGGGAQGWAAGAGCTTKFGAWTDLEWGGDWRAAQADAMERAGNGEVGGRWPGGGVWLREVMGDLDTSRRWVGQVSQGIHDYEAGMRYVG